MCGYVTTDEPWIIHGITECLSASNGPLNDICNGVDATLVRILIKSGAGVVSDNQNTHILYVTKTLD